MSFSRTNNINLLRWLGISLLVLFIIGYTISRSLNYFKGPEILIDWPANGATATTSTIVISGQAVRLSSLFLNGNPLSMNEQGLWSQKVLVFRGINRITLSAKDQFGRSISKELDLVSLQDK
ncbi:MAG: hypothetical protein WCT02_03895 [Candidatus Paceibacterota bacterium]|jgi:hypothetical protein